MNAAGPMVSVLTPVHNGEAFLAECIESVLTQTFADFEYIIVNNGSTDRSLEIAQSYARRDGRIRLIDNDELFPALVNFNHMLRQMSIASRYCKIIHADDWMAPDCLQKMIELAEANPSVGVVASYRLVGDQVEPPGLDYRHSVISGREAARMNLLDGPYTFGTPSALLLRADLVRARDRFYAEDQPGADTEACLDVLRECDFGFVFQVLTYTRVHDEALSAKLSYFGSNRPNYLHVFRKYGREYLTAEEYTARERALIRGYYRYLGGSLGRWRDRQFWSYHQSAMARVGIPYSRARIARAGLYHLVRSLVDTKAAIKSVARLAKRG